MAKKKEEKFDFSVITEYIKSQVNDATIDDKGDAVVIKYPCDSFTVRLKLEELLSSITFEYSFTYSGETQAFELIDIFNVLDIKDFSDYTFIADKDNELQMKKSIDDMLYTIKKFSYDIAKAGEQPYIDIMKENAKRDKEIMDSNDVTIKMLIRANSLQTKMQRTKTEKSKNAFLKEMKARDKKGLLTTYDKRFVEYIEQGYAIPDVEEEESGDYLGLVKRELIAVLICVVVAFVICFGIFFFDKSMISAKGIYLLNGISYVCTVISSVLMAYAFYRMFKVKLTVMLLPDEEKEYAKAEAKKDYDSENIIQKIWRKYLSFIIAVIGMVVMIIVASAGVCFAENEVIDHQLFLDTAYKYENISVELVQGWRDDDDNYAKYDYPYYRIVANDNTFDVGEIKDKDQLTQVEKIFSDHNIVPTVVEE